jgi:hypothetical protein
MDSVMSVSVSISISNVNNDGKGELVSLGLTNKCGWGRMQVIRRMRVGGLPSHVHRNRQASDSMYVDQPNHALRRHFIITVCSMSFLVASLEQILGCLIRCESLPLCSVVGVRSYRLSKSRVV